MGMTLKELLTKGEGTLTAGEAKTLASQCRMDVETLYTLLEERGIKILDDEADGDTSLDVEGIMAEVESAEANSDELGLGDENEDDTMYTSGMRIITSMNQSITSVITMYTMSAVEFFRILLVCFTVIARILHYQRLVSFTRRAIAFALHSSIRFTTELNRPTAVEYEYCMSCNPRLYTYVDIISD